MKSIVVVGDVMVDHHLYEGERSAPTMDDKCGVREHVQLGGAASIVDVFNAAFDAARRRIEKERADAKQLYKQAKNQYDKELAAGKQTEEPKEPEERPIPEEIYQICLGVTPPPTTDPVCPHHAFAVWKPHPKKPKIDKLVWRANLVMGYGNKSEDHEPQREPEQCQAAHPDKPMADVPRPTVLVLDDAGYVFRHREHCDGWLLPTEEQITKNPSSAPEWIVLKMSAPVAQGDLFGKLLESHLADRVVCLVSAQELRHECIGLSRGLSWEQTVEDLSACLESNPILKQLLSFRHLIVTFGLDGALWLDFTDKVAPQAWLICDAGGAEGQFAADLKGEAFGYHSALVVAVARSLVWHSEQDSKKRPPCPDLKTALASGLTAMRDLIENGHGEVGPDAPTGYPAQRLAAALDGPNGAFARIPLTWPRLNGTDQTWRIVETTQQALVSTVRPSLLGLARQVVLNGTDVLKRVPHAKFGDLFTADRLEMEALRSIRRLMRDYRENPKTKKPLSLGVFGPPGAGKSFGVREIAKSVFDPLAWREFNLSQFANSKDLIGAFHQVRDDVLSGVTPVVFWDEFDSQEYKWLQYLLAPMQDGRFQEEQLNHAVGKCVFVFAGATSHTYADFGPSKHDAAAQRAFRLLKGPDFHSRLDAYYDVLGPNQRRIIDRDVSPPPEPIRDVNDVCTPLRRAIMLRGQLKCSSNERLDFDPDLVDALLEVADYKHGARSLEKLVSGLRGARGLIRRSTLPSSNQLGMHVDAADFALKLAKKQPLRLADTVELMAPAIHETWRELSKKEGWKMQPEYRMPYKDLGPVEKEENRAAARRIPEILGLVGLVLEKSNSGVKSRAQQTTAEIKSHLDHHIELLAEAEHDGWMAHRLRNGWHRGDVRNDKLKIHHALVAYAALSEVDKKKDRNSVRHFPDMVELAGYEIAFLSEDDAAAASANRQTRRQAQNGKNGKPAKRARKPTGRQPR